MDLYSIEKTKDYVLFKFISWYYKLTPKMIRTIKGFLAVILIILGIIINHLTIEKLPLYIYCIICLNILYVVYVIESLIRNLAKGTGNERMIEITDALKESIECFIKFLFRAIVKVFFFGNLCYGLLIFFSNQKHQKQLSAVLSNNVLVLLQILFVSIGILLSSASIFFSLWLSVIANIRASAHSIVCYNEYIRFTYGTALTMSVLSSSLSVICLGILFLITYAAMYLGDMEYYSYPYEKCGFILVPYLFGIVLGNVVVTSAGSVYSKTAFNCVRLMNNNNPNVTGSDDNKIENYLDNTKNPIVLAEIIGENIKNVALSCHVNMILIYQIVIVMFITSSINDKMPIGENSLKRNMILFPFLIQSLNIMIELMRFCCIKTKSGFPQGGTDYQTTEEPLHILEKGSYIFLCLKILLIFLLSFILFSSKSIYEIQMDMFWLYNFFCIVLGIIIHGLLEYFTKIYTDPAYPSIRHLVSMTQEGYLGNIIGGISNGIESAVFPCLLIAIALVGSYNLGNRSVSSFPNIDNIHQQLGLYYTTITLLGFTHQSIFGMSINHTKSISYDTYMIIKGSNYDPNIQLICAKIPLDCKTYQYNHKASFSSIIFFTSFILINSLGYIYSNLNLFEFKIDIYQPEVFIAGFIGIMIILYISSIILETIGKATQISVKELTNIFMTNTNSILVERTKLDYHQCIGLITQVSIKELYKLMTIVIITPLLVSHTFKFLGYFQKNYFIGIQSLISFYLFALCTCIIIDIINNNTGSAWENTRYYIKTGGIGSLGLDTLKYSAIGDNIGMLMKDVLGLVMNQIIILLITFGMFFAPFI